MLSDFIAGLALVAVGGFLILIVLPGHGRRRYRRYGEPQIRELRYRLRRFVTVLAIGAGLFVGGTGIVVIIVSLAGIEIGLV